MVVEGFRGFDCGSGRRLWNLWDLSERLRRQTRYLCFSHTRQANHSIVPSKFLSIWRLTSTIILLCHLMLSTRQQPF
ncbi:hypothetical protein BJX64DRAFT_258868 [Aspergillus heterothallicus]